MLELWMTMEMVMVKMVHMMHLQYHTLMKQHQNVQRTPPTTSNGWNNLKLMLRWNPTPWMPFQPCSRPMMRSSKSALTLSCPPTDSARCWRDNLCSFWRRSSMVLKYKFSDWATMTALFSSVPRPKRSPPFWRMRRWENVWVMKKFDVPMTPTESYVRVGCWLGNAHLLMRLSKPNMRLPTTLRLCFPRMDLAKPKQGLCCWVFNILVFLTAPSKPQLLSNPWLVATWSTSLQFKNNGKFMAWIWLLCFCRLSLRKLMLRFGLQVFLNFVPHLAFLKVDWCEFYATFMDQQLHLEVCGLTCTRPSSHLVQRQFLANDVYGPGFQRRSWKPQVVFLVCLVWWVATWTTSTAVAISNHLNGRRSTTRYLLRTSGELQSVATTDTLEQTSRPFPARTPTSSSSWWTRMPMWNLWLT